MVKNAAAAFGERLRTLMVERGLVSPGAKSGVDVTRLAEAADSTYEMARRYAEGQAIPRPDKLSAIARWLGVSSSQLAYGDKPAAGLDEGLLEQCIGAIQVAQERAGVNLPTETAARMVARLYREAAANGGVPAQETVDMLVRFAR